MQDVTIDVDFALHSDYRLLMVDEAWLSCGIEQHDTLSPEQIAFVLKEAELSGEEESRVAVAHNSTTTMVIQRVEYSNSLLLAQDCVAKKRQRDDDTNPSTCTRHHQVQCALQRMFEAHAVKPMLYSVWRKLSESYLTLEELDASAQSHSSSTGVAKGQTLQQLSVVATCSPHELASALVGEGAVMYRGKIRLMLPSVLFDALHSVVVFLNGLGQQDSVSWEVVMNYFCPSIYPTIVMEALRAYLKQGSLAAQEEAGPDSAIGTADEQPLMSPDHYSSLSLDAAKSAVALAGHVFSSSQAVVNSARHGHSLSHLPLTDFYNAWVASLPESWKQLHALVPPSQGESRTYLSLLRGEVVCQQGPSALAYWLPQRLLPLDITARLALLFELNPSKWLAADLRAYVEPVLRPDQNFAHVILRYAREYRVPGQPHTYGKLGS